jgi:hypothetical protein
MDGYALRRAKVLLIRVGIIEFHRFLDLLWESSEQQHEKTGSEQPNAPNPE